MYSTTDLLTVMVVCLALGAVLGAVAWDVLATGPARTRLNTERRRRQRAELREYAASTRAAAFSMLLNATVSRLRHSDTHNGSRKAAHLEVVS